MDLLNVLVTNWSSKLPQGAAAGVKKGLESLSASKIDAIQHLKLKDPFIALVLGILVGCLGIDRFYKANSKKDMQLGAGKLCLGYLYVLLSFIPFIGSILTVFVVIVLMVWVIVDLFMIQKEIREDNLATIQNQIAVLK